MPLDVSAVSAVAVAVALKHDYPHDYPEEEMYRDLPIDAHVPLDNR